MSNITWTLIEKALALILHGCLDSNVFNRKSENMKEKLMKTNAKNGVRKWQLQDKTTKSAANG